LTEAYVAAGWQVVGTRREPLESAFPGSRCVDVDLLDRDATAQLVLNWRPEVVHHLAAQSSVSLSMNDPLGTLTDNATMQFNVLEAVAAHRPDARVVVTGSSDEYGFVKPEENPIGESQELRPINPYALSKVVQDLMGLEYALARGLDIVRVRPFLQLGPRRPDRFAAGAFARQIAEIRAGLKAPMVEVGNVDLVRDFCDVRDVARAYLLIAQTPAASGVFNIASGDPRTLRDVVEALCHAAGVEVELRQTARLTRSGEPPKLVGDATLLRSVTGWMPEISFDQSAADTLEWWLEQLRQPVASDGEAP